MDMDYAKSHEEVGPKSKRKPRFIWTANLEDELIAIWPAYAEKLAEKGRKKEVWEDIQRELVEASGTYVAMDELISKLKNLKRKYRDEQKKVLCNGGYTPAWGTYEKLHDIMRVYFDNKSEMEEVSQSYSDEYIVPMSPDSSDEMSRSQFVKNSYSPAPSGSQGFKPEPENHAKRKRKRSFRAMLLEEFRRSNVASESIARERNDLQKEANALLARSLKVQEEILTRITYR